MLQLVEIEASYCTVDSVSELQRKVHSWQLQIDTLQADIRIKDAEIQRLTQLMESIAGEKAGKDGQKLDMIKVRKKVLSFHHFCVSFLCLF